MSHTAALSDIIINSLVTLVSLETAPKTKNSDHVFSLWRVVLCKADATEHVQEGCSVYSFVSLLCFIGAELAGG